MLETQRAEAKSQFQSPTCSLAVTVTYGAVEGGVKRMEASGWTNFKTSGRRKQTMEERAVAKCE